METQASQITMALFIPHRCPKCLAKRDVKVYLGAPWVKITGRSALLVKQLGVMVMKDVLSAKVLGGFASNP